MVGSVPIKEDVFLCVMSAIKGGSTYVSPLIAWSILRNDNFLNSLSFSIVKQLVLKMLFALSQSILDTFPLYMKTVWCVMPINCADFYGDVWLFLKSTFFEYFTGVCFNLFSFHFHFLKGKHIFLPLEKRFCLCIFIQSRQVILNDFSDIKSLQSPAPLKHEGTTGCG